MSDFYDKWFSVDFERIFPARGEFFEGDEPSELPLEYLLDIDKKNIKPFTKEFLEGTDEEIIKTRNELSCAVRSYFQFQDIFGVIIQNESDELINRHYCYYESVIYLTECLKCWLGNNLVAAFTLLRPFLELSLLHIYWYLKCEFNSYDSYYKWLKGEKSKPPFKNMVDYIFENLDVPKSISPKRVTRLKQIINNLYSFFCNYNHTPKLEDSLTSMGNLNPKPSYFIFTYLQSHLHILLTQIVYLYLLVYPKSLFPIDRIRIFGFSGPLGVFFDYNNYNVVRKFIGDNNINSLRNSFREHPDIISHLKYISDASPLNEKEIEISWQEYASRNNISNKIDSLGTRISYLKAHTRATCFALNYVANPFNKKNDNMYDDDKLKSFIMNW